jgi:murein L,D-transpeptidase YafK
MHTVLRALLVALVALVAVLPAVSHAAASPKISRIRIVKSEHRLELLDRDEVVRSYRVAIGPGGPGPKLQEGDRVTPVGRYRVVTRHRSQFRIFLGLDYPNAADRARFARLKREGALPPSATIGSAIGIHGPPITMPDEAKASVNDHDWTLGCVALGDDEIRAVARIVPDGTVVDIED